MDIPTDSADWPPVKVYNCDFRKELCNMARAVTELELWEWFRNIDPPKDKGYVWWANENSSKITKHPLVENCGHSGATEAYAKRIMQSIAEHGFKQWASKNHPSWYQNKVKTDNKRE